MPRPKILKPKLCHHKRSGRAFVVLDGRFVYLGKHGTQTSRDAYDRTIGEWIARGRRRLDADAARQRPTFKVVELIAAFWQHAKAYYKAEGGELDNYRLALRPLKRLYGRTPAAEFGPLALKALRTETLKSHEETDPKSPGKFRTVPGWSRTYANRQIGRIKHVFKWGVSVELIPATVHQSLVTVEGLRRGRCDARETSKVQPVDVEHVNAALRLCSKQVKAMIQLQLVTGMRPGEVCAMRHADITIIPGDSKLWQYKPAHHKTEHHDHERIIYLGPKAQALLQPFLKPNLSAHVFSPADAEADRLNERRKDRGTPMTPAHLRRRHNAQRRQRHRAPGTHFTVASYRRAIARACARADRAAHKLDASIPAGKTIVPTWHPHQLRHNAATWLRATFGLEAAQVILGHKTLTVTQVYAERNVEAARRIMGEAG